MPDSKRVLIAEDDEGLRYAIETAFRRGGFDPTTVESGRGAVQALNEAPDAWSCLVLDMIMPDIHGSSVLSHVARVAPDLPVIVVSGYPDRVLFTDPGDRHVVKAIFVKPVDPTDIVAYVKSRVEKVPAGS